MKVKELMIGDLVYEGTNHPIKIKHNYGKSVRYDYGGYSHEVEAKLIHPIPLTPEILELNGFYLGRTSQEEDMTSATGIPIGYEPRWCIDDGDVEVTVSFPNESDGGMVTVDNLKDKHMQFNFDETIFVHEFQQVLRLCGLNEFENNFKVK